MRLRRITALDISAEGAMGSRPTFLAMYDNMGEPYREGATFVVRDRYDEAFSLFLEQEEARRLRDWLTQLLEPA